MEREASEFAIGVPIPAAPVEKQERETGKVPQTSWKKTNLQRDLFVKSKI